MPEQVNLEPEDIKDLITVYYEEGNYLEVERWFHKLPSEGLKFEAENINSECDKKWIISAAHSFYIRKNYLQSFYLYTVFFKSYIKLFDYLDYHSSIEFYDSEDTIKMKLAETKSQAHKEDHFFHIPQQIVAPRNYDFKDDHIDLHIFNCLHSYFLSEFSIWGEQVKYDIKRLIYERGKQISLRRIEDVDFGILGYDYKTFDSDDSVDLKYKFNWGKFSGKSMNYVIQNNPTYILWALNNIKNFCLSPLVVLDYIILKRDISPLILLKIVVNIYSRIHASYGGLQNYFDSLKRSIF